jgi:phage terminase large subunit-like protein
MIRDNRFSLFLFSRQVGKSTIATIFLLWIAIFQEDQRILLVANKENTAKEIFRRVRFAYENLPVWLKAPVEYYGLESMELSNGSKISITTTTGTAGRGSTANILFVDEADWIEPNMLNEFWASVYPIISSSTKSKIIMASTPRDTSGLFYRLYDESVKGKNAWVHMKVLWNEVPGRDEKWARDTMSGMADPGMWKREFECVAGETLITILNGNNEEQHVTIEELYSLL